MLNFTHSVVRTPKLSLPPNTSYQPISCRISDWKYLIRIRVTCRSAVLLKLSTANIPAINWTNVNIRTRIPNEFPSLISSLLLSCHVAFVLNWKIWKKSNSSDQPSICGLRIYNSRNNSKLNSLVTALVRITFIKIHLRIMITYKILPPPNICRKMVGELVP